MGTLANIWSVIADQVSWLLTNQDATKGEFLANIDILHCQMKLCQDDLLEANNQMNYHQAILSKYTNYIKRAENHSNYVRGRVTILEGDWGCGQFLEFWKMKEQMEKLESLFQDLQEEGATLHSNPCHCFDTGSRSLADAEGKQIQRES